MTSTIEHAAHPASRLLLAVGLARPDDAEPWAELAAHGWRCHHVADVAQALQAAAALRFDALLTGDAALRRHGTLARAIAALRDSIGGALLVLASQPDEIDEIVALELGADDYLAAPCHPRRLRARLGAALRAADVGAAEAAAAEQLPMVRAGFSLHLAQGLLRGGGCELRLPAALAAVLGLLLEQHGRVVSRSELARRAGLPCSESGEPLGRGVDMQLHHLRRRLAEAGVAGLDIETVRGLGYALRTNAAPAHRQAGDAAALRVAAG